MVDKTSSKNQPDSAPYWSLPVEDLLSNLSSRAKDGLSGKEAEARLKRYGLNQVTGRKSTSGLFLFLNQFKSPIILILLFATAISALLQDWVDSVIILAIILISALLSFIQEYSANSAAAKLKERITLKAQVVRDGVQKPVAAEEIVPGDIVLLSAGSLAPADGVVLESRDLFVNQAILTGETFPVEKMPGVTAAQASLPERTNTVFMGANVRSGSGRVLIVETGARTVFGQIANRLNLRPPETDFERGIRRLGDLLTEVMLVLVVSIFALNVFFQKAVLDSLLFSIALAVGLTPQLLPAIIEVNLSRGSRAMASAGVIVRRLSAIENFGGMDILCTDKTGTLTEGIVKLDGACDPAGKPSDRVFRYAFLNAHFQTGLSNNLDEALTSLPAPDLTGISKVDEIPYDFVRKRLTVVICQWQESCDDRLTLITKGALTNVLDVCTQVFDQQGQAVLDDAHRAEIQRLYEQWSGQGYRVLGVAVKDIAHKDKYTHADEAGLVFVGFLLFSDPPKKDANKMVANLEALGIQLKIITGDNQLVARHTVESLGMEVKGILTGKQINLMNDEALWHVAEKTNIFAEVDPSQKEKIILSLKKMRHVVGYMGDGVNDAPALHSADVGISVDTAVDVAKEAADFVLLHQDLGVLRDGVLQGRRTFANTLKYIFMATSANFGNMFSVAGISLFLPFLPMLPKQILLINLLTDLPEMTIATDRVDEALIQSPQRWDIGFIRRFMLIFGPLSSLFDFATFGALLLLLKAGEDLFRTGWFVESVLSASLVVFVLRTRFPSLHSRPSLSMVILTAMVCGAAILTPYLPIASILGFKPLPLLYLAAIVGVVILYIGAAEITKRIFYRHWKPSGASKQARQ